MANLNSFHYQVVDVFTQNRLEGNALAVFPDGGGIDGPTMQRIARELNLSETVFILPPTLPGCAAKLRIFTPGMELKFAGHPTVGTSFVLLEEGMVPKDSQHFVLEENIGPVPVRVDAGRIWFTTPPIHHGPLLDRALCAEVLGLQPRDLLDIDPQLVSAGNPTIFIALRDRQAVDRAWLDTSGLKRLTASYPDPACVFIFAPTLEGAYSRMFAPLYGVSEDPATGSSTGPLAAYMMRHGLAPGADGSQFVSEQGTKMGRRSLLYVDVHGENGSAGIEVGGYVTPLIRAVMQI